jgi:hypothetical protein
MRMADLPSDAPAPPDESVRPHEGEYARPFLVDFTRDNLRFANLDPRHVNLLGISGQWVTLEDTADLAKHLPAEAGANALAWVRWCRTTKRALAYETDLETQAGGHCWLTQLAPLIDEQGQVWRIIGTLTPITERKRLRDALTVRERRMKLLYDIATRRHDGVDAALQYALETARAELGLQIGLLNRVHGTSLTVEYTTHADLVAPGTTLPLSATAYRAIVEGTIVAFDDGQDAYATSSEATHLRSGYLVAPLRTGHDTYGLLCFSTGPSYAFGENDRHFVRHLVQWMEMMLENGHHDAPAHTSMKRNAAVSPTMSAAVRPRKAGLFDTASRR